MIPAHQTNFAQLIDDVKMSLAAEDEEEAMSLCIAPQFSVSASIDFVKSSLPINLIHH